MPEVAQYDGRLLDDSGWSECAGMGARARSEVDRRAAVATVIGAMRERLDGPFTLEEMARIAFLSPFYFNRVFRQLTGIPPCRFHTALRMAAAKRLLLTTDLSVTEVCLDVGYQSLGTFTTHFHNLVGVSPRELRRLADRPTLVPGDLATPPTHADGDGSAAVVKGTVRGPAEERLIFVGLFADPYPQRVPVACTAIDGPGRYELRTNAEGRFHVAAAAFPRTGDPLSCLLPDEDSLLVASCDAPLTVHPGRTVERDLWLRSLQAIDPPILLALPLGAARDIAGLPAPQAVAGG